MPWLAMNETPLNAAKLAVKVHKRKETGLKALADMGRTKVKKDKQGVWSAVKKWSAKAAIERHRSTNSVQGVAGCSRLPPSGGKAEHGQPGTLRNTMGIRKPQ